MTMQYDVNSVHLNQSGFGYIGRVRVKGMTMTSTSTGGAVSIFDSLTAPVTTGTYARSGTTVTVTQTSHGLNTIGVGVNGNDSTTSIGSGGEPDS